MMKKVNLEDFASSSSDDLTMFRNAAGYCTAHPETLLVIPEKVYFLRDPRAAKLQKKVMEEGIYGNDVEKFLYHKDFPYVSTITFENCRHLTVEAQGSGATLLFDGFSELLTLKNCQNLTLKGIRLDLKRKPYSCGIICAVGAEDVTVDFKDPSMLSEKMPVLRVLLRRNGAISGIVPDLRRSKVVPELLGKGKVCFHNLKLSHLAKEGDEFNLWHCFHFRPAIHLYDSENITLKDVKIFSQAGMGILGYHSKDILLENIKVIPSPGEGVSTNTDATHFASCKGYLSIRDSEFSGHGDDAVNVHTYYHRILKAEKEKCSCIMELAFGTHSQKSDHFDKGDILELTDPVSALPLEKFTVMDIKKTGHCASELILDHPLPVDAENKLLIDISQVPRFEFKNCKVSHHIARGILIKSRHVTVENNVITGSSGTGIELASESFWLEGPVSGDVLIRNNKILHCGGGPGTIHHTGGIVIEGGIGHKNIRMENNEIICPKMEHGICLSGGEDIYLQGNHIESAGEGLVVEKNCKNVIIEDEK